MIFHAGPYNGLSRYRLTVVKFEKIEGKIVQILLPLITVESILNLGQINDFGRQNGSKIEQG